MSDRSDTSAGWRRLWGLILLPLTLFLALGLLSYDWQDIGILRAPPNHPPHNLIGPVGAWLSFGLLHLVGIGAFLAPLVGLCLALILFFDRNERVWPRGVWLAVVWLAVIALIELSDAPWLAERCRALNQPDAGGLVGRLLVRGLFVNAISPVGTGILAWSVLVVGVILLVEAHNLKRAWTGVMRTASGGVGMATAMLKSRRDRQGELAREQRRIEKERQRLERLVEREKRARPEPPVAEAADADLPTEEPERTKPAPVRKRKPRDAGPAGEKPSAASDDSAAAAYRLPPLDLLGPIPPQTAAPRIDTTVTAQILVDTLGEFGIDSTVTNIQQGPVVTSYELLPAPGVRVERISGLSNNLALALKATSVRVQAPIPGKGVVGVEVPNATSNVVVLRELLEGKTWKARKAQLPLALGKDVGGQDIVADLAAMPHLLIAGATGAGKTVCMNSILAGLLMAMRPDELRLLLVDPKIVEFSAYNHLPHLIVPVITDPHKVALGLRWAINEMEKRYKLFAQMGVRNIMGYNSRKTGPQSELFGGEYVSEAGDGAAEPPARLPYIVIVIDELADLMLAAQADIENAVARLAQLSRAVGIHMILSTQRPSVNVITGTIKANFPARIAFQVAQRVDSRTILDTVGADKLLGRGDMLFMPPGASKLARAQGAMTTDHDIHAIVEFIKRQAEPEYEPEVRETMERAAMVSGSGSSAGDSALEDDDMLLQAVEIIRETHRASTSSLQRRLRIGYTRAARIMDILEERGIIGPPRGSEPREILIDLDGGMPETETDDTEDRASEDDAEEER